jgi:hypothetical protein
MDEEEVGALRDATTLERHENVAPLTHMGALNEGQPGYE